MTDAALLDAVRLAVRAEVEPLRRALERLAPPPMDTLHRELLAAIADAVDWPFRAGELLGLRRSAQAERRRLDSALAAMNLDDAHRLGMALAEIAKRSTTLDTRLVRAGRDSNATLWVIEREPDAP